MSVNTEKGGGRWDIQFTLNDSFPFFCQKEKKLGANNKQIY